MAGFDPTVLSEISGMSGDPMGSVQKGLTLKDLFDQQQLTSLQIGKEKLALADTQKAKEILKKSDISTPEGMMRASEALNKAGLPDQAMSLLKASQQSRQQQVTYDESQIELLKASSDILGPAALQVKQTLATQGPAMARAQYQALVGQILPRLPASAQGQIPAQPPQDDRQFAQMIDAAINNSAQARQIVAQQLATRKEETAEKTEAERERHDIAMEGISKAKSGGGWNDKEQALLAALADRSANLPAGSRSQAMQHATISGLISRHPEMSPDEIAEGVVSGKLKLAAETKGAQVAGTQIGKVALASNELDTFGDQVVQASNALPRGVFVPWNQLRQKGEASISNPQLLNFKAKMQALENAYNQLAARSGTDVEKRAHIHELFNTANSPQAVQTLVQALKQEASAARQAASATIAETSGTKNIPGTGTDSSGWGKATVVSQ